MGNAPAGVALGLALAWLQGALLVGWLWPRRARPALVLLALALPAGLALSSSACFLWIVLSGGRVGAFPALELLVTGAAALVARRRVRRGRLLWPRPARPGLAWGAPLFLVALAGIVLALLSEAAAAQPWGHWDAWAMINQKARFLAAGGDAWRWIFEGPTIHHRDYPLLLSASVARLWSWSAFLGAPGFAPLAPQVLSLVTFLGCLAALVAVAALLCAPGLAALTGLGLFALGWDLEWGAMQYADFAQATYLLWGAGILALAARRPARAERWCGLLGFLAGASAWCKNEGLAFAALLLAAALLVLRPGARAWARLAGGALVAGLAAAVLKLGFAGKSRVFEARTRSVWTDLADGERYRDLVGFLREHVGASWIPGALLALLVAALLLPPARGARRAWIPLGLALAQALVFALVMLTTREDFAWHLVTAADRLLLQVYPLALLGVAAALRPR
ncbi:MAG TPA: hypothetical protein VF530_02795 [Planctomycetota bacterium]